MAATAEPAMIRTRLAGFGLAYFFVMGVVASYWPVWLQSRGVDGAEIGTIYMARQVVTVAATLAAGWVVHRFVGQRKAMIAMACAGILAMTLYEVAWGFWALLAVTLARGALWEPLLSQNESIVVSVTRERGLDYGRLRIWSSLAFIAGVFGVGLVVTRFGVPWVLYLMLLGSLLVVPAILLSPRPTIAVPGGVPVAPLSVRALLRQPAFLLVLVAAGCSQASHAVLGSFGTIAWRAAGISDLVISALWVESVAIEIGLFVVAGALTRRIGPVGMLTLGAATGIARWLAMPWLGTDLAALVVLQALHAGTFGATHLGAIAFLQRAIPAASMTQAQSLYYALSSGLIGALVFQLAGTLYERFGGLAYLAMAGLSGISLLACLALWRRWKGEALA